jgi:hypothetical protein
MVFSTGKSLIVASPVSFCLPSRYPRIVPQIAIPARRH